MNVRACAQVYEWLPLPSGERVREIALLSRQGTYSKYVRRML
jgi:hypothetical protein